MYLNFTRIFQNVLNKHAPLKQKKVRGNHAAFINKDLSKAIMNKSKTRIGILNGHQGKTSWL